MGDVLGEESFRVSWLADPRLTAMHTEVARFEPDGVLLDSADAAGYGESWNNATWLYARDRPIAVIVFTAHTRELAEAKLGVSERSKGAAFVGFVPKPFDLEELIDVVGRACYVCRGTSEIHENMGIKQYGRDHSTMAITAAMIRTMAGGNGEGLPLERWTLETDGRTVENVGWSYREPPDVVHERLRGHVAFYWSKLDAWFEEDDEVFAHPRDPYHRVDVLNSSRHIRVVVDGQTVADTRRPRLLFETGLPTRYYIPKMDVRLDLLVPSDTSTRCPYKGRAVYWSVRVGDKLSNDLVWSYPLPIPECPKVENLLSFFNENVDIYVDGELQPRPTTQWS